MVVGIGGKLEIRERGPAARGVEERWGIDCDGRWLGGGAVAVAAGIRALGENKVQRDKVWLVSCLHPRGEQVRILPDLLRAPIRKKLWRRKEVLSLLSGGKDSRPQKLCARYRSSLLLPRAVDC